MCRLLIEDLKKTTYARSLAHSELKAARDAMDLSHLTDLVKENKCSMKELHEELGMESQK